MSRDGKRKHQERFKDCIQILGGLPKTKRKHHCLRPNAIGLMRYLLDTNIFVFAATDPDRLSVGVKSIISDYNNTLYISMESVRELIIAYRNKRLGAKTWHSEADIINSIKNEYFIQILPVHEEHMQTYAKLALNETMCHRDPSDHIIIAHAITERIPLISSDSKFPFYRNQGLELVQNI